MAFGGAYSNHIRAVAAAGYYFGFTTVGVIRGEEHLPLNPSLAYAVGRGMHLTYLDRTTYRDKMSPEVIRALHEQFGEFFLLPEGLRRAFFIAKLLGSVRKKTLTAGLPAVLDEIDDAGRRATPAPSGPGRWHDSRRQPSRRLRSAPWPATVSLSRIVHQGA